MFEILNLSKEEDSIYISKFDDFMKINFNE